MAGEPVVVHVRVENELKDADVNDTIVGRAGGRHTLEVKIQRYLLSVLYNNCMPSSITTQPNFSIIGKQRRGCDDYLTWVMLNKRH